MPTSLCGSELYANQVLCEVINNLDGLQLLAEQFRAAADAKLAELQTTALTQIGGFEDIDYAVNTSAISHAYSAPTSPGTTFPDFSSDGPEAPTFPTQPTQTEWAGLGATPNYPTYTSIGSFPAIGASPAIPAAYTVPAATTALISDASIDAIFEKESARLARESVKEERDAVYMAASMGIGLASSSLMRRLLRAQQGTNELISKAAEDQAIQEGQWKREDAKVLHELSIRNWPLKPTLDVEAWKTQSTLDMDGYRTEATVGIQAYEAEVRTLADTYRTTEEIKARAFQVENEVPANVYGTLTRALTDKFSAEVQWTVSYKNAETTRYSALVDKFRTEIQSEGERRGWSQMHIEELLQEADKQTQYAISKAELINRISTEAAEKMAQFYVGLTASLYSAANYNLSGQGSQSVTESIAA